jgi:peptidoglycan/xylan/chitin deacetylase (PgdA/CDA1 family)
MRALAENVHQHDADRICAGQATLLVAEIRVPAPGPSTKGVPRSALVDSVLASALLLLACASSAAAQSRTVSLTFDDLPAAGTQDPSEAASYNRRILNSLAKHHAPAIGFVNEDRVIKLNAGPILYQWVRGGLDLGNHTFSHADLNKLTTTQFEQEIIDGEPSIRAALWSAGKVPRYLRFPFNHTGDTAAKHEAVAAFLAARGYQVAACTIDNEDYLFNEAYLRMLAKNDEASAVRLRDAYLAYTATQIDYYSGLHEQVFRRPVAHVMLFHLNRLNADLLDQLLGIFEEKHYTFVTLDAAQSDAAYNTLDTYVTGYGPMWGYRWARELKVAVNGNLETDPPDWISKYPGDAKR